MVSDILLTLENKNVQRSELTIENLRFHVSSGFVLHLRDLPWRIPLEEWDKHGARFVHIKSGLSRHVVRFVDTGSQQFAIKQTTPESAMREHKNYLELERREVPTLLPVGVVVRDEGIAMVPTDVGGQMEPRGTGFLITRLMEKVIPDSHLFRRGFSKENRKRIWDAVIALFAFMHSRGVYWGDASLANMLIRFENETVPELGRRTRLTAVLADAETVEIHTAVSDALRLADLEFFLESMLWTEADLKASGMGREPVLTPADQQYVRDQYAARYAVELEAISFEIVTHIDVDKLLGGFDAKGRGPLLLQHINEHKWYLSEQRGEEVPMVQAAEHWYAEVFKTVCHAFQEYDLLEFFPDATAASLYVEVMEHKYYLSRDRGYDVGLADSLEDYVARFARNKPAAHRLSSITKALKSLVTRAFPARNPAPMKKALGQ